jgi:hypothetical protein
VWFVPFVAAYGQCKAMRAANRTGMVIGGIILKHGQPPSGIKSVSPAVLHDKDDFEGLSGFLSIYKRHTYRAFDWESVLDHTLPIGLFLSPFPIELLLLFSYLVSSSQIVHGSLTLISMAMMHLRMGSTFKFGFPNQVPSIPLKPHKRNLKKTAHILHLTGMYALQVSNSRYMQLGFLDYRWENMLQFQRLQMKICS